MAALTAGTSVPAPRLGAPPVAPVSGDTWGLGLGQALSMGSVASYRAVASRRGPPYRGRHGRAVETKGSGASC